MSFATTLRDLLFGKAEMKAYRDAVHDGKNTMQASSGAARRSKKASEEALRSAQCAIKLLERSREPDK